MKCDYAACDRQAFKREEGWWFCRPHLVEHRQLMHPEIRARWLSNSELTREELLAALLEEITRPVPPPCYRKIDKRVGTGTPTHVRRVAA